MKSLPAFLGAAALLTGCNALDPRYAAFYDQEAARLNGRNVGLIATGCVVRDEIGGDHIVRDASARAARTLADVAYGELRDRGMAVSGVAIPLLCAGVVKDDPRRFPVAESEDAEAVETALPLTSNDALAGAQGLRAAYAELLRAVALAKPTADRSASGGLIRPAKLSLSEPSALALMAALGASDVWVINALGTEVSFGKTFGTAFVMAAVTVATLGVAAASAPMDGAGVQVALVDLQKRRLIWKRQQGGIRGNPTEADTFQESWTESLFQPFLPEFAGVRSGATLPEPATITVQATGLPVEAPVAAAAPIAAAPVAATPVFSPVTAVITLRARPLPAGDVVATLERGTPLERGAVTNNPSGRWCFVRAGGKAGWVSLEDLDSGASPAPAPPAAATPASGG